jgi:hypothetical protein
MIREKHKREKTLVSVMCLSASRRPNTTTYSVWHQSKHRGVLPSRAEKKGRVNTAKKSKKLNAQGKKSETARPRRPQNSSESKKKTWETELFYIIDRLGM